MVWTITSRRKQVKRKRVLTPFPRRDLEIPDDMPLWDAEKKDFVISASAQ